MVQRIRESSFLKPEFDILTVQECKTILEAISATFAPPNILAVIMSETMGKDVTSMHVLDSCLRGIAPDASSIQEAINQLKEELGEEAIDTLTDLDTFNTMFEEVGDEQNHAVANPLTNMQF